MLTNSHVATNAPVTCRFKNALTRSISQDQTPSRNAIRAALFYAAFRMTNTFCLPHPVIKFLNSQLKRIRERDKDRSSPPDGWSHRQMIFLLLEGTPFLQRAGQPPIVPQKLKHLADPQVRRVLHLHEPFVGGIDLGRLLGGQVRR